jgi:hypothetical protein
VDETYGMDAALRRTTPVEPGTCDCGCEDTPAPAAHPVPGRRLYEQIARLPTRSEWTPDRVPFVKQDDVLALVRAAHDEAARYEIEAADYRKMYDDTRALLAEAVAALNHSGTVLWDLVNNIGPSEDRALQAIVEDAECVLIEARAFLAKVKE